MLVKALAAACRAIRELVEIASWYKFETVHRQAVKSLRRFQKALEQLSPSEKLGMDLVTKRRTIVQSLRALASK